MTPNIQTLLKLMVDRNASDLHLSAHSAPQIRIDEKLVQTGYGVLTPEETKKLGCSLLTEEQIKKFELEKELDMSFGIEGLSRFRTNLFYQRGCVGVAIRALPFKIMTFEECGLPVKVTYELCNKPKGLILVTGATGSGKSTTIASMIDKINTEHRLHIVTIEDPIEYVHKNKMAIVDQREIHSDTRSFAASLRHVLRQDPDVILIGEMRDLETMESALNIAETGHLVFATLHTSDSVQSINRIIDVFPSRQQQQVRTQLSFVLQAVLAQQLIPKASQKGRVLAAEVLIANSAVRSLIRDQKIHQVYSVIQTSQKEGMKTMNQALYELVRDNVITREEAMSRTTELADLERMLKKE